MAVQIRFAPQKEDALDKVIKAVSLANQGLGVASNVQKLLSFSDQQKRQQQKSDMEQQRFESEQKSAQEKRLGVTNPTEIAKLGLLPAQEGDKGAILLPVAGAEGKVEQRAFTRPEKFSDKLAQQKLDLQRQQLDVTKGKDERERLVPGVGLANTKEDALRVKKLRDDLVPGIDGIDQLIAISDTPLSHLNPNQRAKAKTIQNTLVGSLRVALTGPGAMSEGDRELLESVIANPTDIFSFDAVNREKLNSLKDVLNKKMTAVAKNAGIKVKEEKTKNKLQGSTRQFLIDRIKKNASGK